MDRGVNTLGERAEEQILGFKNAFTAMAGDAPQLLEQRHFSDIENIKTPKKSTVKNVLPLTH